MNQASTTKVRLLKAGEAGYISYAGISKKVTAQAKCDGNWTGYQYCLKHDWHWPKGTDVLGIPEARVHCEDYGNCVIVSWCTGHGAEEYHALKK